MPRSALSSSGERLAHVLPSTPSSRHMPACSKNPHATSSWHTSSTVHSANGFTAPAASSLAEASGLALLSRAKTSWRCSRSSPAVW
eukprot:3222144-Rhodomonas_salina.1